MKILFLGDVVGNSGCKAINENLQEIISKHSVDFTIVNGENSGSSGVGITEEIAKTFFSAGVDVITTGNHVWDEKEIMNFIDNECRLLRPLNLITNSPGNGFGIFLSKTKKKIGVLNLMGNIFMKKCEDAFVAADNFKKYKLKRL